jgi:phage baseplate assembly protein W
MSFDLELINNDIAMKADGKIRIITDTPKLRQDIIKLILTPLGSVKSHRWYGCALDTVIGQSLSKDFQLSRIIASITQSLERLQALQISQSSSQKVSLAELLNTIGGVTAERDIDDGRKMNIIVTVFSKRLSKIEELFTLIA